MLTATRIEKRFGRVRALEGVDFEARAGEIHALLGENGAGKSTLMGIVSGRLRPDRGSVLLEGRALSPGNARQALSEGIAAVHQSPLLLEHFSWEENLALGGFTTRGWNPAATVDRAARVAAELGFVLPPPGIEPARCSVAQRVRLEILRALSFNPRVLILDEPTSLLGPAELHGFLATLRRLRSQGRAVILVTHRLGEALAVADRLTVLRSGRTVATLVPSLTSEAELAQLMIGTLPPSAAAAEASPPGSENSTPLLELSNVRVSSAGAPMLSEINLRLGPGEIVGVAGLEGNGQEQLTALVAGAIHPDSGAIRLCGHPLTRAASALAVIPQDRDGEALILTMALWENLLLAPVLRERLSIRGLVQRTRTMGVCAELLNHFDIRAQGPHAIAAALSGGNRQRFVVARAVACEPAVIVAHNPTRGLDFSATREVHRRFSSFAARGGAVLLISSDLDELLGVCGRLLVLNRGRLIPVAASDSSPEGIGLLMAGAQG